MDAVHLFQRLGLALAIGFLTGVERGWKQRHAPEETRVAGLRTYTLIGGLGGVSGLLGGVAGPFAFAALALTFGLAWIAFKLWETWADDDLSVTGTIAGFLVFALGAYAVLGNQAVAAAGGVVLAGILAFKQAAHSWIKRLTFAELQSALLILAATLIALPLLPNRAIDPFGVFNPHEVWLLTIIIAGASFAGYLALRILGPRSGLLVGAALGALVSSTVVTFDLARRVRRGEAPPLRAGIAAVIANIVMLARVSVLCFLFVGPATWLAALALLCAGMGAALAALAFWLWPGGSERVENSVTLGSPLDLPAVVRFACVLALVMAAARITLAHYEAAGLAVFASIAGLVDVDAVVLAVGEISDRSLTANDAATAVLLAAGADTLFKAAVTLWARRGAFSAVYAAAAAASFAAGAGAYLFASGIA